MALRTEMTQQTEAGWSSSSMCALVAAPPASLQSECSHNSQRSPVNVTQSTHCLAQTEHALDGCKAVPEIKKFLKGKYSSRKQEEF